MSGMTQRQWYGRTLRGLLGVGGAITLTGCFAIAFSGNCTLAQIIPDRTLGAESSVATPHVNINGLPADRINGGATRGVNLFHSFSEFNVGNGQRVYFANPIGIENILTRVTGSNLSNILGTLGVEGGANLFLLNPNGIFFGPNARLDIAGSFFASTADSVVFNNGYQFSAKNPDVPPLLTINVPLGLQYGRPQPAAIVNAGNLAVGQGQYLGLSGGTVVSTGQLLAPGGQISITTLPNTGASIDSASPLSELLLAAGGQNLGLSVTGSGSVKLTESGLPVAAGDIAIAGGKGLASLQTSTATLSAAHNLTLVDSQLSTTGNLHLLARDTVRVRDSLANPFSAQAGGNLDVRGNQGIDILALNHPGNAFESGRNLRLVSDGIISGDAHFASGGSFSILNLLGNPGNFVSLYDPIISSVGDVVLGNYTGAALKVESMGSITVGDITITGRDSTLTSGSDPDIDILKNSPALILRAGLDKLENPPTSSIPVYSDDFEGEKSGQWSDSRYATTPSGRNFLGEFAKFDGTSLTVDNLPSHTSATVSFDLFIIRSWDGNNTRDGPDIWELSVAGGSTLLRTTFSNAEPNFAHAQAFPSTFPGGDNYAGTGAERNTLGYYFRSNPLDSVYHLEFPFPHSASSLTLNFSASGSGAEFGIGDESWGLDNVKVSVEPTITSPKTTSPGSITAGNLSTPGGPVILSATNNITLNGSITSQGGNISLNSGGTIDTTASKLDSFSVNNGGAIRLIAAGDIKPGDIRSSSDVAGGKIALQSGGGIFFDGHRTIHSDTFGSGQGGDIEMAARSVFLTNGAQVLTGTFSDGVGGNLSVTADLVELVGTSADGQILTFLSTSTGGSKPAGNLKIDTNRLIVRDGAVIYASTSGAGHGGNLTINASELVELSGSSVTGFLSGLSADTAGVGTGGNLMINTRRFVARNGGAASASTFGAGQGFSAGQGGSLTVNASESVELSGTGDNGFASGLYAQAFSDGNAGNLTIHTQDLIVRDRAKVTVASGTAADARVPQPPPLDLRTRIFTFDPDATGTAGHMTVTARSIFLDNQGKIIAQTDSTEGGNITLNVQDLLLMRHNSLISATAGTAQAGGNGGNIMLNAQFIVAVPQENSDITANAFLGNGGRVQITAQGVYGSKFRPYLTPTSDITASSEFGVNGVVEINTPGIDPARGLSELPSQPGTPKPVEGCQPGGLRATTRFIDAGRGGLSPSPTEPLSSNQVWRDVQLPTQLAENSTNAAKAAISPTTNPGQIVEAQGWIIDEKGNVKLVAEMPSVTAQEGCPRR